MERKVLYCGEIPIAVRIISFIEHCAVDQNFAEGT
jgi:hypothetical protein